MKSMGFNTIRKHIKIEPARWYYYCDTVGMLVWQDMVQPAADGSAKGPTQEARAQYEAELKENFAQLHNHPSIITWGLFNEGWGSYDQERLELWAKKHDPSRLVNGHSGAYILANGQTLNVPGSVGPASDFADIHSYPSPAIVHIGADDKALVLGEYGGVGVRVKDHMWIDSASPGWSFEETAAEDLPARYAAMFDTLKRLEVDGLTGSFYTQPFDVEGEHNGLITYDREVRKIPLEEIRRIHAGLLGAGSSRVAPASDALGPATLTHAAFGKISDGVPVELYTLRNRHGMEARIATYGGIVTTLTAPDRQGLYADVVLGYDTLDGCLRDSPYFGALIGRYGNRIARGHFSLDGKSYSLATNNGPNALHGGTRGFDKVVWTVKQAEVTPEGPQLMIG